MIPYGEYIDATTVSSDFQKEVKEKKRSSTDIFHLFAFITFVALWFGIAIYAFSTGSSSFFVVVAKSWNQVPTEKFQINLHEYRNVCSLFIWLGVGNLALYFVMIRWLTKYIIYVTFLFMEILYVLMIVSASKENSFSEFVIPSLTVSCLIFTTAFFVFRRSQIDKIHRLIQDACKVMFCFPSALLIVLSQITLISTVVVFTMSVIVSLDGKEYICEQISENIRHCRPPNYFFVLLGIFVCCSLWIIFFILAFGRMVLHGMFSAWYLAEDKTTITRAVTLKCLHTTASYHLGTLAFGSTIFTLIQKIRAFNYFEKYHLNEMKGKPMKIFCYIFLFVFSTANSLIGCAVHGSSFYRSMKASLKLIMQSPYEYVAMRSITIWMIIFGMILIPLITISISIAYYCTPSTDHICSNVLAIPVSVIGLTCFFITGIFLYIFNAAIEAVTFCYYLKMYSNVVSIMNEFHSEESLITKQVV